MVKQDYWCRFPGGGRQWPQSRIFAMSSKRLCMPVFSKRFETWFFTVLYGYAEPDAYFLVR